LGSPDKGDDHEDLDVNGMDGVETVENYEGGKGTM
jgi:hypothetical protein